MIKILQKVGIKGTYLNITKAICDKPTVNIIHNSEKLKEFPLISGTSPGYPLSPLLFSANLEVLSIAMRKEKVKGIQNGKEKVTESMFADDIKLHMEDSKDATKKTTRTPQLIW